MQKNPRKTRIESRCDWFMFMLANDNLHDEGRKKLEELVAARPWTFTVGILKDGPCVWVSRQDHAGEGTAITTTITAGSRPVDVGYGVELKLYWTVDLTRNDGGENANLHRGDLTSNDLARFADEMEAARKEAIAVSKAAAA